MKERLENRRSPRQAFLRSAVTANVLYLSALLMSGSEAPQGEKNEELLNVLYSYDRYASSEIAPEDVVASAAYKAQDGQLVEAKANALPKHYSEPLKAAIIDPIVELAVQKGDVTQIGVELVDGHDQASPAYYDGGVYANEFVDFGVSPSEKSVILNFDSRKVTPESKADRYYDDYTLKLLVIHESVHGLNNDWWNVLKGNTQASPKLSEKISSLQRTCGEIEDWFDSKNAPLWNEEPLYVPPVHTTDIFAIPGTMPIEPQPQLPVADAAPEPDPQNCRTSDNVSSPYELPSAFRCVTEGYMLREKEQLEEVHRIGHPHDNASELASSVTALLRLNPEYIQYCMNAQDPEEAAMIKKYVKATLELSFLHRPELEQILRQDPKAAKAIDFLMASA